MAHYGISELLIVCVEHRPMEQVSKLGEGQIGCGLQCARSPERPLAPQSGQPCAERARMKVHAARSEVPDGVHVYGPLAHLGYFRRRIVVAQEDLMP